MSTYVILLLIGVGILLSGVLSGRKEREKYDEERTLTTGKIIAENESPESGEASKQQMVQYRVNEKIYKEKLPANTPPVQTGATVDIYFNTDHPTSFHIGETQKKGKRGLRVWIGVIWITVVIAMFMYYSYPFYRRRIRLEYQLAGMRINRFLNDWKKNFRLPWETPEPTPEMIEITPQPTEKPVKVTRDPFAFECSYHLDEDGAVIESITGDRRRSLTIPPEVDGHPVVRLQADVFSEFNYLNGLTLPGSMKVITPIPFQSNIIFLKRITIESGTERIESESFARCRLLEEVRIPETVTFIADDAFPQNCKAAFFVTEGSEAERYCWNKGFTIRRTLRTKKDDN